MALCAQEAATRWSCAAWTPGLGTLEACRTDPSSTWSCSVSGSPRCPNSVGFSANQIGEKSSEENPFTSCYNTPGMRVILLTNSVADPGFSPGGAPTPKSAIITARKRSLGQGNIFTPVCHSVHRGGACVVLFGGVCVVLFGGHAWFYLGGCAWFYLGGHAWFYSGGVCGFIQGGHAWFYSGGHVWLYLGGVRGFIRGACVVLFGGGHAWFYSGGVCVVFSVFLDTMRYGQWAGGTHPTGMHSCFSIFCRKLHENERIWIRGGARPWRPPWIRQCNCPLKSIHTCDLLRYCHCDPFLWGE